MGAQVVGRVQAVAAGMAQVGQQPMGRHGQAGRGECGAQRDQVDAAYRRQSGQGAFDVGIADAQPGKAGEDPATSQFGQCHGAAEGQDEAPGGQVPGGIKLPSAQAAAQPGAQRRIQGQIGGKEQGCQCGQRGGHATVVVHADVDPADAGGEPADAEQQAQSEGARRGASVCMTVLLGVLPDGRQQQAGKAGQYQQFQPVAAPGGEGEGMGDAQSECGQRCPVVLQESAEEARHGRFSRPADGRGRRCGTGAAVRSRGTPSRPLPRR